MLVERQQGTSFSLITEIVRGIVKDKIFEAVLEEKEEDNASQSASDDNDDDSLSDSDFSNEKKDKKRKTTKSRKSTSKSRERKKMGKMETIVEKPKVGAANSDSFSNEDDDFSPPKAKQSKKAISIDFSDSSLAKGRKLSGKDLMSATKL